MSNTKNRLLLGTRKGLAVYTRNGNGWQFRDMTFHGIPVSLAKVDPRTNTWWAMLDHGHWGVKLHKSTDEGATWEELAAPKFPEGEEQKENVPATVKYLWALEQGGSDNPERLWFGTVPGALFRSDNNGKDFSLNRPLWDHPTRKEGWFGGGFDSPGIHSIVVDPRDSDHIFIGISCAGVFESTDAGKTWEIRNKGLYANFLPDPHAEVGHDPHLLLACNSNPEVMWQQNHCGIFRTSDGAKNWEDISEKDGVANFGFVVAVNHDDENQAWVVPAISDENRIAIDGALVVCRTDDGGKSWKELRNGLPQKDCFDIVYRHGMDVSENVAAFGTTTGNLYMSNDYGEKWECLSNHLPMIHSVHFAKS